MAWRKKKAGLGGDEATRNPGQRQEATLYEALAFFDRIKIRYVEYPEVFVQFLDILDDYRGNRADCFGLLRRCSVLFADTLDFIEAFNSFLPPGYQVECRPDNDSIVARVTIPEGTRIDTRISLGSEGTGPFISEINTRFAPGQSASGSAPPSADAYNPSKLPDMADVAAPGLQVLADLAARPSISVTARDALRAKHESTPFPPQSAIRPFYPNYQPRDAGYTFRPNDGASTFFPARKARRTDGDIMGRSGLASSPRHMTSQHRSANDSSDPDSSPDVVASPQSSFSRSGADGLSPMQENSAARNMFQMQTRFNGRRISEPGRKWQEVGHDGMRKGSTASGGAENSGKEFSMRAEGLNLEDDDSPRPMDGSKAKSRNKRLQAGQAKTGRTNTNRAFPCPFAIYGCPATFGSKNEWKRHVNTQHMRLGYWRCDLCDQGKGKPNDFNRKDLFIQHIRRMHSTEKTKPVKTKPAISPAKNDPEEQMMAAAANRCFHQLHQPPHYCACNFCDQIFQGEGCWDERLEHVGRHIETMVKDGEVVDPMKWKTDLALEQWLIRENLLRRSGDGWVVESNGQWLTMDFN